MNWIVHRPRVYRYLESAHVEEFFSKGRLKLSSFKRFAQHKDEHRLDENEGNVHLVHRTSDNGGQTLVVEMSFGEDAYVLCGSLLPSLDLMSAFKADSAIVIIDPVGFATSVAAALKGFRFGADGPCSYQYRRLHEFDFGWLDLGPNIETSDITKFNLPMLQNTLSNMVSENVYFLKHSSYVSQAEWRFIWLVDHEAEESIIIDVPEARKFCVNWASQGDVVAFGGAR